MITSFSAGSTLLQAVAPNSRLRIVCIDSAIRPRPLVQLIVGDSVVAAVNVPGRMTAAKREELRAEWSGQIDN